MKKESTVYKMSADMIFQGRKRAHYLGVSWMDFLSICVFEYSREVKSTDDFVLFNDLKSSRIYQKAAYEAQGISIIMGVRSAQAISNAVKYGLTLDDDYTIKKINSIKVVPQRQLNEIRETKIKQKTAKAMKLLSEINDLIK